MSKKIWAPVAIGLAILLVGAYLCSPFLAMPALRSAARSHDAERLERVVDFPAVREGLKSQLNAMVMRKVAADPDLKGNPFAGLALMLAPMMVDRAVDGFVTANSIAAMADTGKTNAKPLAAGDREPAEAQAAAPEKARVSCHYKDLGTFVVTAASPSDAKSKVDFVFRRTGLFGWRLERIGLPETLAD
jgi:hypothetical protein